jgi:hypothetical protein
MSSYIDLQYVWYRHSLTNHPLPMVRVLQLSVGKKLMCLKVCNTFFHIHLIRWESIYKYIFSSWVSYSWLHLFCMHGVSYLWLCVMLNSIDNQSYRLGSTLLYEGWMYRAPNNGTHIC